MSVNELTYHLIMNKNGRKNECVRLFLCGDVMTGRGIDQIMPNPSDPRLYEPFVKDARFYVKIAEKRSGSIKRVTNYASTWTYALKQFALWQPNLRIINLETSITSCNDFWPGKGINYRMHPSNIGTLTAAKIDCCILANNHTIDWGRKGLEETIYTLKNSALIPVGAGRNISEACQPASFTLRNQIQIKVYAWGLPTSGIPKEWQAQHELPGVNWLSDLSPINFNKVTKHIQETSSPNDLIIASFHWGENWGYSIPNEQRYFAHQLIDKAGVHVVHGHSSHHPKAIEIYKGHPILYGSGDFINDYEGISGYEKFRNDLCFMYFLDINMRSKKIRSLHLVPTRIYQFAITEPSQNDRDWQFLTLDRECKKVGTSVILVQKDTYQLHW